MTARNLAITLAVAALCWAAPGRAAEDATTAFLRGTAAYEKGDLGAAAEAFQTAAALDPADGEAPLMEGIVRYRLGERAVARRKLQRALRLGLDTDDRALAEEYLALASERGARPSEWFGFLIASAGAGYDTNVLQSGLTQHDALEREKPGAGGGGFSNAMLILSGGRQLGPRSSTEIGYTLFQIAYPDPQHQPYSVQDHSLEWRNDVGPSAARLSVALRGELSLAGLGASYGAFQRGIAFEPQLSLAQSPWARLRAGAVVAGKEALDPAFVHLDGWRAEGMLTQELRFSGWSIALGGRYRHESLGFRRGRMGVAMGGPCDGCSIVHVTPYSYGATGASLRFSSPADELVRAALFARGEARTYVGTFHLEGRAARGRIIRWGGKTREDRRLSVGGELRLGGMVGVTFRYEAIFNGSNVDGTPDVGCGAEGAVCHPLEYDTRAYTKHLLTAELELAWL